LLQKNQNCYLFTQAILIKRTLVIFRAKELGAAAIQILGNIKPQNQRDVTASSARQENHVIQTNKIYINSSALK